jgi:acetyl esterase
MHKALLTPAMTGVLQRMARARRTPMHLLTPQQARDAYEIGAGMLEVPKAALARVDDFAIPARDGFALPARRYAPSLGPLPTLLYLHGGGFMVGSVNTHDILCRELSRLSDCAVVSLGYRLAPEHRFPTAVEDAWDALAWLATQPDSAGVAVGGDSAGGTLAAVCAILARDAQLPLALQLLFYPGCAAHADTPSHSRFASGLLLEREHIHFFFNQYLRTPADYEDWRFAPLEAPDVDGVAPAWFGLAECDPLVDEGLLYADKLRLAGVPVDLDIYRGVTHEFIKMGRAIPEAKLAHQAAAQALRNAFSKAFDL